MDWLVLKLAYINCNENGSQLNVRLGEIPTKTNNYFLQKIN